MTYTVIIKPAAQKSLERIPAKQRARIALAIRRLSADPRPQGALKLQVAEPTWRIRIGNYRAVYEIRDDILYVLMLKISDRKEIYRHL